MKRLVIATLLVFTMGIACVAYAEGNPFSDVPANHWAYKALLDLQRTGLVDGYGDSSFKGIRVLTRYEMVQIGRKSNEPSR